MRDYNEEIVYEEGLEGYDYADIVELSNTESNLDTLCRDLALWGGVGKLPDSAFCNLVILGMKMRDTVRPEIIDDGFDDEAKRLAQRDSWSL